MRLGWLKQPVQEAEKNAENTIKEMIDIINRKDYSVKDIVRVLLYTDKSLAKNQYLLIFKVIEKIIQTDEKYATYHITSYEYRQIIEHGADFPAVATITRLASEYR